MKVIDLLNKIAKGEEVPKKIKYKCDIYIIGEDVCNKDVKYINEKKDVDGYTKYLFQDWILDVILNDEIEIIEEEKEDNFNGIRYFVNGNCYMSIASEPPKTQDITIEKEIEELNIKQEKNIKNNWKWKIKDTEHDYNISTPQKIMCDKINELVRIK